MIVTYTPRAESHLKVLPKNTVDRILEKMRWYCDQEDPLAFAVPLTGTKEKLYRFRVGDHRIIFMMNNGTPTVVIALAVKHRREAYRKRIR